MGVSPGWIKRLAVVATSYRRVGFGRLGSFSISPDSTDELRALKDELGATEFVFVSTCNRVECYLVMPADTKPDAAQLQAKVSEFFTRRGAAVSGETFFAATGREAAHHLLNVVSSLDSLVLGETEIAGQAKRCLDRAKAAGLCGQHLPGLFDYATATSRRIRSETAISSLSASVATIALRKVRKHFGKVGPGVTVLVGVGDMCRKVAQALNGTPGKIVVVNRTLSRAEAFCAKYGGVPMSLEAFKANPPGWIDLLFTATSAEETVIDAADLAPALNARRTPGVARPLIVCDLGLPRDVDPALESSRELVICAMEQMEKLSAENQVGLQQEVTLAKEMVEESLSKLLRESNFRQLAGISTSALINRQLGHLCEKDQATILKFVSGLAGRMARQPLDLTG